jgi:DNA-binding response OmpR family regulator
MPVVLIVEGETQVLVFTESYLREQGHHTLSARTATEALAILESQKIDLLFADIGLSGDPEAGIELARKAKACQPNLQVLYTTGQSVTDGRKAFFVNGSALLTKPYTVDKLIACLSVHFRIGSGTGGSK